MVPEVADVIYEDHALLVDIDRQLHLHHYRILIDFEFFTEDKQPLQCTRGLCLPDVGYAAINRRPIKRPYMGTSYFKRFFLTVSTYIWYSGRK